MIDIFVLRLDELLGEIILSKLLGLILVLGYVWAAGRRLSSIGFHRKELVRSLKIAVLGVGGLFLFAYLIQWLVLVLDGNQAAIVFSAVDPKTGMAGGMLFAIWLGGYLALLPLVARWLKNKSTPEFTLWR